MKKCIESDSFWTIGNVERKEYIGSKDNGCYYGETLIAVSLVDCDRFGSYEEVLSEMRSGDVADWVKEHGGRRVMKPVRVTVSYSVSVKKRKRCKKGVKRV